MNQPSPLIAACYFLFYVDPGAGSLIWQLLLAAFFGGLFYYRKFINAVLLKLSSRRREEHTPAAADEASETHDPLPK